MMDAQPVHYVVGRNDKVKREVLPMGALTRMHGKDDPTNIWWENNRHYTTVLFVDSGVMQTVRADRINTIRVTGLMEVLT
jgi:hypothetical protein